VWLVVERAGAAEVVGDDGGREEGATSNAHAEEKKVG
jgi:hypothetical protein